jgi:hypothetical protein
MQRFVLRENIKRFQSLLAQEESTRGRATLQVLLTAAERDLTIFDATDVGAAPLAAVRGPADRLARGDRRFVPVFQDAQENYLLLDPGPGLHIVDLNDAYARATLTSAARVAGERLFDVFPDNPDDPLADGVSKLFHSLKTVVETGRAHAMDLQRYDVRDATGCFVARYWRPINTPLFSEAGDLIHILHQASEVTHEVEGRLRGPQAEASPGFPPER